MEYPSISIFDQIFDKLYLSQTYSHFLNAPLIALFNNIHVTMTSIKMPFPIWVTDFNYL